MSVDDLRLRTKTLIPLSMMALTVLAMVAFGATKLESVSVAASDIIEHRDLGATTLVRAARGMVLTTNLVFGALIYESTRPMGHEAETGFPKAVALTDSLLESAAKLLPEKSTEIAEFKQRYDAIAEKAKAPFQIGLDTPGLEQGRQIKPEVLEQMAQGAKLMEDVTEQTRALVVDITSYNDALIQANAKAAEDLRAESADALLTMSVVGVFATLAAGAFALWMSSSKIARPLARLADRMKALARGDLAVEIEGQQRRDEVGEMAAAVGVFKVNAIERARAEKEAAEHRDAAERERERAATDRARAAEEQAEAMRRLGEGLKNLASGDLRVRLDDNFSARYAQIRLDFNEAVEKLKETMQAVVSSASAIQSGTREIAAASDDLARRTEQQASSLEQTAEALDEITATVKKSAEGAKHARDVVANADQDAKKGAVVARQAVEAMDGISKSSGQIGQIIGVIDEIAFQTNLLALNAGVEAARAGEAGRGFAVVASEVRALAQRSAEAAKEIKALISASTGQVDVGVELVAETGKSLERIIKQVTEINSVVSDIAAGAQEQATALQEINTTINQMDKTTQQNANMVQESSAASHSLSQETSQLSSLVDQFQVGDMGSAIRRELQKVAPHAFRTPMRRPSSRPTAAESSPDPRPRAPRAKAAGGGGSDADEGWDEF